MSFYLTNAAVEDMLDIGAYTEDQWGREQRNRYLDQLDQAFHDLNTMPEMGLSCDHYRAGYRQFLVGRHWIFYRRLNDEDIEIVRILHELMDPPRHLE